MIAKIIIENQNVFLNSLRVILFLTLFIVNLRIFGILALSHATLPQIIVIKVISDIFGNSIVGHHIDIRSNPF